MPYTISNHTIYHNDEPLGPDTALYLDPQEGKQLSKGVIHRRLPSDNGEVWFDGVMAGNGKTVILESKKPGDLRNSHKNRRLARQLREALRNADRVILLLRPGWMLFDREGKENFHLFRDLARFQAMGVYVLPGPVGDARLATWLWEYRKVVTEEGDDVVKALGGSDKRPDSKDGWYLVKALKGMGPKQLAKVKESFASPFEFLVANDEELKAVGVNKRVVEERRRALSVGEG